MNKLSFGFSWLAMILGLAFLITAGWLSVRQWRRSGARPLVMGLEILRWVIVFLLFLTLMRPEFVRLIKPTGRPEIAILWDGSRSMRTVDVAVDQTAKPRHAWVKEQREAKFWAPLENRYTVHVEEFSPMPTNAPPVAFRRNASLRHGSYESSNAPVRQASV